MSSRFPFTSYPQGWFQIAWSDELPVGGVLPITCFGTELVLFRTGEGEAHVLDAYCPHLGAHLGHGGRVEQGTLQCPFHGWRFDGRGACVGIPHASRIPPGAVLTAWPVQEVNGLILVHHAPGGAPPGWSVPALAEYGSEHWTPYQKRHWRIRTHVQEIAENIVDPSHFLYVHQTLSLPESTVAAEGHVFRSSMGMKQPTPRGPVDGRVEAEAHGLGVWFIRFSGIIDVLLVSAGTPIGDEHLELRLSFMARQNAPGTSANLGNALITEVARQVEEDIPIWENKIYRPKPLFAAGDGSIAALRKWSRQFLSS
jgi:nitrite reductase/ring-hydroxylating ferredoxin subunit